ncbi:MAG: DUF456 domain-containing protein, partial [Bacteroidales bacterium]|nr:DUF456 domain-containing protein [Bacteroidales bacterium]
ISYLGILLLHFTSMVDYSLAFLIGWAIVVIIVQILDYFVPIWGTKKFGGSKAGSWGSGIGLFLGMFLSPWGVILGPFVGAVIGELISGKEFSLALRAGFGSFIGFLVGTIMKLIVAVVLGFFFFKELFIAIF